MVGMVGRMIFLSFFLSFFLSPFIVVFQSKTGNEMALV